MTAGEGTDCVEHEVPRGERGDLVRTARPNARAVNGGGFVLGGMAMIADDLANGRLVIPIDRRLSMPDSYYLAWDPAVLDRPFGKEFRAFVIGAARRQAALSKGGRFADKVAKGRSAKHT